MKRFFLLIMLLNSLSMMAQSSSDYVPLVREGVSWDCEMLFYRADNRLFVYPYTIEFRGDTVINDQTYKKCYYFFDGHTKEECDSTLRAFVREDIDTRQVWGLANFDYKSNKDVSGYWGACSFLNYLTNDSEPVLIYDFLNPSSTEIQSINEWQSCHKNATINVATDYIDFCGSNSRKFIVSVDEEGNKRVPKSMSFVEGIGYVESDPIGCSGDLLKPFALDIIADMHTWKTQFLRMRNAEGEVIYSTSIHPESSYIPLVREGVSWECAFEYDYLNRVIEEYPYTIKFQGDTVIDGKTYKKCYQLFDDYNREMCDATLMAFVRENTVTRQVWALPNKDYQYPVQGCFDWYMSDDSMDVPTTEVLLYDFSNVTSTDVHRVGAYFNVLGVMHKVEIVVIDGLETRRHTLMYDNDELHLIEGVGFADAYGDLFNLIPFDPIGDGAYYEPKFYRMKNAAGEVIYRTDYDKGNKENSVQSVVADEATASIDIYNVQGVLLMQDVSSTAIDSLDAGLYIIKHYNAAGDCIKTTKTIKI
ncbi:MAG: T9SS type A sorting domain-containing protein [Muribaculaceae bacterium]|nr:T9SS type A sorting domain-containing protein [Muribaculaceae bacterium]